MPLLVGDSLPMFRASSATNPNYAFDSAAGRYILLGVLAGDEGEIEQGIVQIEAARAAFNDHHASAFGLLPDTPHWRARVADHLPGTRWLFDTQGAIAMLAGKDGGKDGGAASSYWLLIDPELRMLGGAPLPLGHKLIETIATLRPPEFHAGPRAFAPVLVVPRIFEPDFCATLIDHYETVGGQESGFMREIGGITRLMTDPNHKKRSDVTVEDEPLKAAARERIRRRLIPVIAKGFQFEVTRMERYLVACYAAESGGFFRPHRDNTTKGTAHRRFAVSINLNADFDGGDLRFPEFGPQTYRPPPGGAVVFSCSLLHEATPVTRGRRFAFLPFLYDEAAARIRQENQQFLDFGDGAPIEREQVEKASGAPETVNPA